jgi:uncharacterized protein GlcG (DUF336 family)
MSAAEQGARARMTITLAAARLMIDAGFAKADEKGVAFAIAVVDESAQPVAFARQDGCALAALTRSCKKAVTAATFGQPTAGFWEFVKDDPILLNGIAGDPSLLVMPGGIPLKLDGQLVGAVGVSGAHYSVDEEVVQAAAAAFPG